MSSLNKTIPAQDVSANARTLKKNYIRVPASQRPGRLHRLGWALIGAVLSPLYWMMARLYRGPGLRFRSQCAVLGLHLLRKRAAHFSYSDFYGLFFWPIDSVRYFEFDFMWEALSKLQLQYYLDISSPRLFPVLFLRNHPHITAEFVNPDKADLRATAILVTACGLDSRCHLQSTMIEDAAFAPESFDAITSISVVEHIPDDKNAIRNIWGLLKPGGTLLLSVPCAALAEEEYIDVDFYGVQAPDEHGFFFHQYKYDHALLEERIFSVTGYPTRFAIFGEKRRGTLQSWLVKRWTGQKYPLWKEPYAVSREFRYYESLLDLPGDGVIAMEVVKK
jgi:predicted SAM-dependent methyltransferase